MKDRKQLHDRVIEIYGLYPRKMGKSAGLKKALLQCKSMQTADLLETAVKSYIRYIERESTEAQYIQYFSTFMNNWRDWLEEETGTAIVKKVDLSGMGFEK